MDKLYCSFCEGDVIEDLPGWLACYCTSAKADKQDTWPDTWYDRDRELRHRYDESLTASERNPSLR